jgi:hypothetical protein
VKKNYGTLADFGMEEEVKSSLPIGQSSVRNVERAPTWRQIEKEKTLDLLQ